MKHLIQFKLKDGSPVYIEAEVRKDKIDVGTSDEIEAGTRSKKGNIIEGAEHRFSDAISRIKPTAEAVLETLHQMNTPDEISMEFGVKFHCTAGAIIASVDSEATFKVSLKWTNKK